MERMEDDTKSIAIHDIVKAELELKAFDVHFIISGNSLKRKRNHGKSENEFEKETTPVTRDKRRVKKNNLVYEKMITVQKFYDDISEIRLDMLHKRRLEELYGNEEFKSLFSPSEISFENKKDWQREITNFLSKIEIKH